MAANPYAGAYNGIFNATICPAPQGGGGVFVAIPRLGGDASHAFGPCYVASGVDTTVGNNVMVGTVNGNKDEIVILCVFTSPGA